MKKQSKLRLVSNPSKNDIISAMEQADRQQAEAEAIHDELMQTVSTHFVNGIEDAILKLVQIALPAVKEIKGDDEATAIMGLLKAKGYSVRQLGFMNNATATVVYLYNTTANTPVHGYEVSLQVDGDTFAISTMVLSPNVLTDLIGGIKKDGLPNTTPAQ